MTENNTNPTDDQAKKAVLKDIPTDEKDNSELLDLDLRGNLRFEDLSRAQQVTFLESVGDTILNAALVRFADELPEEQVEPLNAFMDTEPETEALLDHLSSEYPAFNTVLEAEIVAYKQQVQQLFAAN